MSYMFKLKMDLIGFSLILFASNVFGGEMATVYFIPFEVETYIPITEATIASLAWEKWTISSESQTSGLIALLDHGDEGEFDGGRVRGLVVLKSQTFFLDADGVVTVNGRSGTKIDKNMFVKFRNSLQAAQRKIMKTNKE